MTISKNIFKASALASIFLLPAQFALAENTTSLNQPTISAQTSADGIVALVNDTPILKSQLFIAMAETQARLKANNTDVNMQQLQNEVLNSMIMRELQLDLVRRAGIKPDTAAVNQAIAQIAQSQGFTSLAEFQRSLDAQQAGSYSELRNRIIEQESLQILQQSQIANRVRITEQDVDAFLASPEASRLDRTEYRTIHIRIPYTDDYSRITDTQKSQAMQIAQQAKNLLQVSDSADEVLSQLNSGVANNYPVQVQGGDMGYHAAARLPIDMARKIISLNEGEVIEPQVTSQGVDVVKLVDKRGNTDMVIPQWKVRHILVKTGSDVNNALAEQKINDIYEQLRRDADFNSLASTYSDDPGSAGRGGDLDWVTEGQMVPQFEAMMKRTPVGDYSTPFQTQFGWHILKVEDMRQQDVSDTVKRNLAREAIYQRLAPQAQEDWLEELRANAFIQIFQ